MQQAIDLTFQRFGRWVALMPVLGTRPIKWLCRCDCGTIRATKQSGLRNGRSQSCGCLHRDRLVARLTTHGGTKTPEYRVWMAMQQRCFSPKNREFHNYGARGISVCDEWRESFEAFIQAMGRRPSGKHTLERVDNSKGYAPDNCVWATQTDQMRNTRRTRMLTYNGKTMCLADWARELGIKQQSLIGRLHKHPVEVALSRRKMGRNELHAGLRHES